MKKEEEEVEEEQRESKILEYKASTWTSDLDSEKKKKNSLSHKNQARGILDPDSQTLLVDAWQSARDSSGSSSSGSEEEEEGEDETSRYSSRPPPQLPASVAGRVASAEAAAAQGDAALSLHALLGSRSDLDVPAMCAREPQLLEAGNAFLMSRLLWLRGRAPPGTDVGALISSQPSLLLQPLPGAAPSDADPPPPALSEEEARLLLDGGEGVSEEDEEEEDDEDETPEELLRSWRAGLVSDSKAAWTSSVLRLKGYIREHGDAAVGTRGWDDPGLVRWAEKQRADFAGVAVGEARAGSGPSSLRRRGRRPSSLAASASPGASFLKPYRRALLDSVGFCFDAEEAEFRRMVAAAARAGAGGEGSAGSGAATATSQIGIGGGGGGRAARGAARWTDGGGAGIEGGGRGDELLLANWCSVQRIARRSGVLSPERIAQLEAIGFDFDGADALS
jgi:hypothetical protein